MPARRSSEWVKTQMMQITHEELVIAMCVSHDRVLRADKLKCITCTRRARAVLELNPEHRVAPVLRTVFNQDHGHGDQKGSSRCLSCQFNVARVLDAIERKKLEE